jgi:hypothetical protein
MPRASRETASQRVTTDIFNVRTEHFEGGYSVCFESHTADRDIAEMFRGLPGDRCQHPRWGYVLRGKVGYRLTESQEETFEAGDAFYVPPGHTPILHAGAEFVEFSPTEGLVGQTIPVVLKNLQAAGAAVEMG